jgi:hypothetical protein
MKKQYFAALIILMGALLACRLPFIGGDNSEEGVEPDQVNESIAGMPAFDRDTFEAKIEDPGLLAPVTLSPAQLQIIGVQGAPNRFVLQFNEGMRQETWYFDRMGYEVTFRNGEIFAERKFEVTPGEAIFYSVYSPWQFNRAMGLSELLSVTETETFAYESLTETFGEALSIAYLKGLDVGFRGDQVLYIRTIPLGAGAKAGSPGFVLAQPTQNVVQPTTVVGYDGLNLTPEELIHQGTHTYHLQCSYSDGTIEDLYDQVTWEFKEEGLYMNGDGPFSARNTDNFYDLIFEDFVMYVTFEETYVRQDGSYYEEDENGNLVQISVICTWTLADN